MTSSSCRYGNHYLFRLFRKQERKKEKEGEEHMVKMFYEISVLNSLLISCRQTTFTLFHFSSGLSILCVSQDESHEKAYAYVWKRQN